MEKQGKKLEAQARTLTIRIIEFTERKNRKHKERKNLSNKTRLILGTEKQFSRQCLISQKVTKGGTAGKWGQLFKKYEIRRIRSQGSKTEER